MHCANVCEASASIARVPRDKKDVGASHAKNSGHCHVVSAAFGWRGKAQMSRWHQLCNEGKYLSRSQRGRRVVFRLKGRCVAVGRAAAPPD